MKLQKTNKDNTPIHRFRVRSKSRPDEFHLLEVFFDGRVVCDCLAFLFGHVNCKHTKKVKEFLNKNAQKRI